MSDKALTELEWKKFSKGRDMKDAAFTKALAALERAKTPAAELEALADIEKQADALRKAGKADKAVGAYFDDVDKALEKQRKLSDTEAKKAAKEAAASDDEEEDSPELLTTKMIPLLRQVKKGSEMNVMVASVGKEVAVLMMRRAVSPSRRKLLAEYLGGGTPKYFTGQCVFEENAYTFVLRTQAGGLARKVKAALLKQVELRLKVRVRGEDPNDIDDDGEPDEGTDIDDTPAAAAAAGASAPAAEAKPKAEAQAEAAEDPLKAAFESRMEKLQPVVLAMLKAQSGDVSKIRAVAEFAREKGEAGNYKAAIAGLDNLAKLLGEARGVPDAPPGGPAPKAESPAAAPDADTAAFTARLAALAGAIKAGMAAGGEAATDIKLKASEAGVFARKKEFDRAHALLDELEEMLGAKTGGGAPGANGRQAEASASQFTDLRARLEQDYLDATAAGADASLKDQIDTVRRAWDLADDSLAAGNPDRALLILKRLADGGALDKLVAARRSTDTAAATASAAGTPEAEAGPGLVKQRTFMLERWARIPAELKVELGSLSASIQKEAADDAPEELVSAIDDYLQNLLGDIQDKLDAGINKGDMGVFKGLRAEVEADELINHLLSAPFMDGSKFKKSVLRAMDEIEAGLTA